MFSLPDLRAAGRLATGDGEWSVFMKVLANVASAFQDMKLGKEMVTAMRTSTDPKVWTRTIEPRQTST
jgi:hypothetical protein